ncbi:tetratricopeptide repeat protein [Streptomyces sp. NPDC048290]|uniref:tetratricopeptide repeat protein n=1 Tax=Streptomyces sp. NPDC048290 TaxID=3155811 RepID=UPI003423AFC6
MEGSGERRARQGARAGRDVTQVAGDLHVHPAPEAGPSVQWPVWVGDVPRRAAAFQPRTAVRKKIEAARGRGGDVVLSGPGGVGKSQLAASLAREARDQERAEGTGLDVLVWVRATSTDQVISAYAEAAGRLRLPGLSPDDDDTAARLLLRWLAATERRWLVVLDDIDDPADVREWWPDGGSGRGWTVATSRRDDAELSGAGRALIRLGLYSEAEARAYFHRRLADAGHAPLHDPGRAVELAGALGHLPLALGHAAAYLINKRTTMADYLALLDDTGNRLGDLLPPSADTEGYGRPVTVSLLLSLEAIEEADRSGLARPLLQLASLMDPLGHPADAWTTPGALAYLTTARPPRRRWLRKQLPAVTRAEVLDVLERLRTYALIAQDTAGASVRMHALTARAARESVAPDAVPALARTAADAIMGLWPRQEHKESALAALLRANAIHLERTTRPALWLPEPHACVYEVSSSLTATGLYHQAVENDEANVQVSSGIHGPDHPHTLTVSHNLAVSYGDVGRVEDALALNERVLTAFERVLAPDSPRTLNARSSLAVHYRAAGRVEEALELRGRVLADRERILGPDHLETLVARHNLAVSYSDVGRVDDALALVEPVLTQYERTLGADHPRTLDARNNLAVLYTAVRRFEESLALSERVLADVERIMGADHPRTLDARSNLAVSYGDVGRFEDALALNERVLSEYERILGADHPDTRRARHNLALFRENAPRQPSETPESPTPAAPPGSPPTPGPPAADASG